MDGKRSLAVTSVLVAAILAGCGAAPQATSGNPAATSAAPIASAMATVAAAPATTSLTKVGGNAPTTIKAHLITTDGDAVDEGDFADSVRNLSNGAIDITVTGGWRPGDPNAEAGIVNDVVGGTAELGIIATRGFDTVGVDSFLGLQAPMLLDSYDLETTVLKTDWARKLLDGTRSAGVVGLGYVSGGLRQPLGIARDLDRVADFQGARIGIRPSRVAEMTMAALGATTTTYNDPSGLDGIEMDVNGTEGNHYDQLAKSMTGNIVFWARPSVIFANARWFDSLTADQQAQLRAAATGELEASAARDREGAAEASATLCRRGFSFTSASSADVEGFRERLQPVTDALSKDPATKATIDSILALRGATDAPDVIEPCPQAASSPSPSTAASPIDGTWTTSFSKADLVASPMLTDVGEINDGNWGDWTLTFQNGKVSYTQSNALEHSSSSGSFTLNGDAITLAFAQGDNAGESFAYRWSVYRNTLTFQRDDSLGLPGPTPFLVKSWTYQP